MTPEAKVEEDKFEENEVYAIDIVVSTGDGRTRMLDEKQTTVFKRALDVEYNLKLKVCCYGVLHLPGVENLSSHLFCCRHPELSSQTSTRSFPACHSLSELWIPSSRDWVLWSA